MSNPTAEQIRLARHLGAKAALSHLPEQSRDKLLSVHAQLSDRRDKNRSEFRAKVLGSAKAP